MFNWLRYLLCPRCPVLRGKDAMRFLKDMESAGDRPLGVIPSPKLDGVLKIIRQDMRHRDGVGR